MNIKKGFTLIELMIAITIIVILTMITYAPYNYYQNKARLKITAREISQLLNESRNMAVNGAVGNVGNVSVGVYFDTTPLSNNIVKVFSYPHDIDKIKIINTSGGDVKLLKTMTLSKGVIIDDIQGNDNMLFVFDSITGNLNYYTWVGASRNNIIATTLSINFSFQGSTSSNLNKSIKYYTNTNIIDY